MTGWLVIAKREFLERVRTKWFAITTAIGPIFMIALLVVPVLLARLGGTTKLAVVDHSGQMADSLRRTLPASDWEITIRTDDPTEASLLAEIRDKKIDGFLVIPKDALEQGEIVYQGDNATAQVPMAKLQFAVMISRMGAIKHLSPEDIAKLLSVNFSTKHTTGEAASASGGATFALGYIVMFILYLAIVLYGVNVMRSVVTEKTSRVVELMIAATKPRALMLGKIVGVGAVGVVQILAWFAMAIALIVFREPILGLFGLHGGINLPPLSMTDGVVILVDFVLGYFFYASLYAAVGAMVSSDQEAQQAQTPITMLLVLTIICVQLVANDPRATGPAILTLVPFSSPILMPMRWLLGGATGMDVALSFSILAASTWLVAMASARIFRVGILMYGKRPSMRELGRWLRYR
ncbi:MAG TPA: ABC transporter permease [Kofleriaceae bacterium]|nr:ABC transporter permease [Kofleriaceae bacterium]